MLEKPSGPQQIAEEGEDEINHEGPYLLICSVVVLGLSYSIWHPLHPVFPVRSGELRCAFLWPCIGLRHNPGYTLDFRNEIALAIFVCGSQVLKTSSFSTSPAQHCLRQTLAVEDVHQPQFTRKLDAAKPRPRKQRTQSVEVCCGGFAEHALRETVRPTGRPVEAVK